MFIDTMDDEIEVIFPLPLFNELENVVAFKNLNLELKLKIEPCIIIFKAE